ncbi:putative bifunctional diguanylate cyclase/phosphodiesterase [Sphingobium sp. CCH11-B1]|jgi:diguanylate cyclase (GGDEF)-like protein|uniref:putative bifunctional diguanylate cyclase/phosphodiesterase n=1 Tax=Sphingobium sp. CCH11-B1 TaxID=1768781 RepID=UPI000829BBA1|nr:bifunctional diguanylate cyclase/phosphodiesterase [Sphingobium sp. CCH11-B1]MEA3389129.1 bifunctional diguanylate cyclase/phosphodiesterase [Pseudomonadota bacterium]
MQASGDQSGDGQRSLFILSPGDRDGLCQAAQRAGWRAIGARRAKDAPQRYLHSEAQVALVDLRGGASAGDLLSPLVPPMEAGGGALLVLIDEEEQKRLPALLAAGATHYLVGPVSDIGLQAALASAHRLVERLGGGAQHSRRAQRIRRGDALYWDLPCGSGELLLSESLARHLGVEGRRIAPATLLRRLPRAGRRSVLAALRTMRESGRLAALAHVLPDRPDQRMVHHLRISDGAIAADVEWLSDGQGQDATSRDVLTGLRSRQAALDWLDRRKGLATTILLLSISQFDRMNAAYGQVVGDALLGRIARRIERIVDDVAPGAMVARIAGTEFLVGLTGEVAGADRATFIARQLIGVIGRPFSAGDHLIRLTTRCGIAQARAEDDATLLLRRAGTALSDARQAGGEGIRILSAERHSRQVDADRLETDLRLALDRGEIGIVFQPQYPVDSDRISGVEALARWNHPHYGPLGAGILFATAERSDYMLPLSAHIQAEALRQAAAWPRALSNLRLSINLTAADIAQPGFLPGLLGLVDASGFPRGRLTVEITESGLIDDVAAAGALLTALRAEGLAVAIDDFGTGYSSLAYLKSLPLDYLKIDSGLAQDIAGTARDRIIVRGVIHMAKSLGLKVIAEGIETEEQLSLLAREGCDYYQGFLRSAGVASADLINLVLAG